MTDSVPSRSDSVPDAAKWSRSPELLAARRSTLLVIDVQEKLVPRISGYRDVVWNIRRLLDAAATLAVPRVATEQYPQGLGSTITVLADRVEHFYEKRMFSCRECAELADQLDRPSGEQLVVCGLEAHVCVLQTVLDILADGRSVYVVADAIGSRTPEDYRVALSRMEGCGATLVTAESVMFEWCETSRHPSFKQISQLIQERPGTGVDESGPTPASPPAE